MALISMTVGAVTDTSARFTCKVDTGPVAVDYSTDVTFPGGSTSTTPSESVNSDGVATVEAAGLAAGTRYFWRTVDNGTTDVSETGTFLTDAAAAGNPMSFTIGCIGDAGLRPVVPGTSGDAPERLSNHPIFDTIRQRAINERWARVCHLGDACYYDLGSGNHGLSSSATLAQYRSMWDDILAQGEQHDLYHDVGWVYMWDDHDYAENNSDSTATGRDNACTAYRERTPHYDLPLTGTTDSPGHYFHIGRVLCVVSDTRADRDPTANPPTILGSDQKSWLDTLLSTDDSAALIWLMPTPWIGTSSDSWGGFTEERTELVAMLADNGWTGRTYMVNADKHATALESGTGGNAQHGGFPIMLCAPLDADIGSHTTQYDQGMWLRRSGQYGTVRVDDDGTDIHITGTVWRGERPLAWHTMTTGTATRIEAGSPSHVIAL